MLSFHTVHRLIATAVVVASKHWEEYLPTNAAFALAAGIPLIELNMLERLFLMDIRWDLDISRLEVISTPLLYSFELSSVQL